MSLSLSTDYSRINGTSTSSQQTVLDQQELGQQDVKDTTAILADLTEQNKAYQEKIAETQRQIHFINNNPSSEMIRERLAARRAKIASSIHAPQ